MKINFSHLLLPIAFVGALISIGTPREASAQTLVSLGTKLVVEKESDGRTFEFQQPYALRAGYRFSIADLYLEYSSFRVSQGTEAVKVGRTHQEALLWGRREFFADWKFASFLAAGAGVQRDTIKTTLGSQTREDKGRFQALFSIAGGLRADVHPNVELVLESALSASSGFSPNPQPSVGAHVGISF